MYRRRWASCAMALVLLAVLGSAGAGEWYVPSEYPTIQAAIDACVDGDVVTVADGVYTGPGNKNLDSHCKAITVRSASGDPQTCIIDCEHDGRGFNFACAVPGVEISGFTVRNGQVLDSPGGGMDVRGRGPFTVANCILTGNVGLNAGGGLNCNADDVATIVGCTIAGNSAVVQSGGVSRGGGVSTTHYDGSRNFVLRNCTFTGNTADCGGGVFSDTGMITIESCVLRENSAHYKGGGVYGGSYIHNSEISQNSAGWYGGGVAVEDVGSEILSCTIADNTADWYGGGVYMLRNASGHSLRNTILSGNWASYGRQLALEDLAVALVDYTDIAGDEGLFVSGGAFVIWGDGVIAADPAFIDASGGDYRLRMDSPCVDAGSNDALPLTDLDGDGIWDDPIPWDCSGSLRVARFTVDMGAYEIPFADLNCDRAVNNFDISAFVLALTDSAGYAAAYPNCDIMLADTNGDGQANNFDISPFVALLSGQD
jgi:hypothetical protein